VEEFGLLPLRVAGRGLCIWVLKISGRLCCFGDRADDGAEGGEWNWWTGSVPCCSKQIAEMQSGGTRRTEAQQHGCFWLACDAILEQKQPRPPGWCGYTNTIVWFGWRRDMAEVESSTDGEDVI